MERDKLIELLENGSESELTLIQNYLLDKILGKLENFSDVPETIKRCVDTSSTISEIKARLDNLEDRLDRVYMSKYDADTPYGIDNTGHYVTSYTYCSSNP